MTPLKQYETTLIWSNDICYNPVEKTGRRIFANLQMEDFDYPFNLSKIDNTEVVKIVVYSYEPAIWSENNDLFICEETVNTSKEYRSIVKKRDTKVSK